MVYPSSQCVAQDFNHLARSHRRKNKIFLDAVVLLKYRDQRKIFLTLYNGRRASEILSSFKHLRLKASFQSP